MSSLQAQKTAFTKQGNPNFIRTLGHVERMHSAAHLLEFYYACAVCCRYVIPETLRTSEPTSPSLEDIVEKAFALAILEHPYFQVGLLNENSKKPSWVRLDRIDLHNHLEWRTVTESENYEDVLREVFEWQLNHCFPQLESQPLWRAVILRPTDLASIEVVFAWGHAAGDGKSGKIFQESLLTCLNSELAGKNTRPLENRSFEVPVVGFTPSPDDLLKFPISSRFFLSGAWNALKPSFLASDAHSPYAVTWAPVQIKPCTTRMSMITVEDDALPAVLNACRQHKTTLTGLIHTLTLVSLASRLSKDKARGFGMGTPVCLRHAVPSSLSKNVGLDMERTVINLVCYWRYKFDEDIVDKIRQQVSNAKAKPEPNTDLEATMWSAAAALKENLIKYLESVTKNNEMGLIRFVGDWRSSVQGRVKGARTTSWEVSNLGVFNGELEREKEKLGDGEKWIVDRAVFTQSVFATGPAITINPIAVKGKSLILTFNWQIEVVDDKLAEGLSSDLKTWLNGLGNTGRIPFNVGW